MHARRRTGEMSVDAQDTSGLSRRDVLKRSAVVGGLVWIAPTILAGPASATLVTCPADRRYAIKHGSPNQGCEVPGTNPGGSGNCAARAGVTEFQNGCCLEPTLVRFVESASGTTHTYTLAAGVRFSQGFAKCGNECHGNYPYNEFVTVEQDPVTGITTVVITCPNLSHSEIVVCLDGSNLPVCH